MGDKEYRKMEGQIDVLKINWWKVVGYVMVGLVLMMTGFNIGRKTVNIPDPKPEIIYVPGETVHDTIDREKLVPYEVKTPIDSVSFIKDCVASGKFYNLFPEKIKDTTIYITKHDTTVIMNDWAAKKSYEGVLFDVDTLGKCTYTAEVQYNDLASLRYTYTPVRKEVERTVNKVKMFSPFIGAGMSTYPSVGVEIGGYFEDRYGVSVGYDRIMDNTAGKQNILNMKAIYKF